jgi:streptogrisin C
VKLHPRLRPRTVVILGVVAAVAAASAITWNAQRAPGVDSVDRAHTLALGPDGAIATTTPRTSAGTTANPGFGPGRGAQPSKAAADDQAASVAYLQAHYGTSKAEATRRLKLQGQADQLDAQLRAAYPDAYAGMWLDQSHGGVLRIATTDASALAPAIAKTADSAHIALVPVQRSLKQLDALADAIRAQLPDSVAQVSVDVTANQVAVYQTAGSVEAGRNAQTLAQLDAAQRSVATPDPQVEAAVAAHPGSVLRQLVAGEAKSAPLPCQPVNSRLRSSLPICPTTRGGQSRLMAGSQLVIKRTTANNDSDNENPMYGECTLGFVVYDASKTAYYGLTAGHCLAGPDKVGPTYAYTNSLTQIGVEAPVYQDATYPTDYGLISITNALSWFGTAPKNQIAIICTTVQSSGCSTAATTVRGVRTYGSGLGKGEIVCATGRGDNDPYGYKSSQLAPGTRCGEVTGTNGGFVTNICSRKGDSGGPLFSQATGYAYGILNDGTAGTSTCGSSEWSQYTPVSVVMSKINQQDVANGGAGKFAIRTTR